MSIAHTILGVLIDAPAHGYSLKKRIGLAFAEELSLNDGQLYPALAKLEQRGWIAKEVVAQEKSPPRHLYRVTPAGREAFFDWLESASEIGHAERIASFWRSGFLQRCGFFSRASRAAIETQVRGELRGAERAAQRLEKALRQLELCAADPYRRMILDYVVRVQRVRRDWLVELLASATEPCEKAAPSAAQVR